MVNLEEMVIQDSEDKTGLLETQVNPDFKEAQVDKGKRVMQVYKERQEIQVKMVWMVDQVQMAFPASKDSQETKGNLEHRDSRVSQAKMGYLVREDRMALQANKACKVMMEHQEQPDSLDFLDNLAFKVIVADLATQVPMAFQDKMG